MTDSNYRVDYLVLGELPAGGGETVLYCDPLTSLVAYPSFEEYLIKMLPLLIGEGLHLAIGDVDGLRAYVSERRSADPSSFGHLAGNACMRVVGELTNSWALRELAGLPFRICGTFGGDEVIVGASGLSHGQFARKVHELCDVIKVSSPRPCSFALATLTDGTVARQRPGDAYRCFVSMVDALLFDEKEQRLHNGGGLDGSVFDLGVVSLLDRGGVIKPAITGAEW
jgi:GGDEF domain-containing protein